MQGFDRPLHVWLSLQHEQYELLLDMGFFIDEQDEVNISKFSTIPFTHCVLLTSIERRKLVIVSGPRNVWPNTRTSPIILNFVVQSGQSALIPASAQGLQDVVESLLRRGARTDPVDKVCTKTAWSFHGLAHLIVMPVNQVLSEDSIHRIILLV